MLRFCVDESLKVPVAVYCSEPPRARCTVPGGVVVIASDFRVAAVTVTLDGLPWPPNTAVITAVPAALPVTHPDEPSTSETVATGGVPETCGGEIAVHVAEAETS